MRKISGLKKLHKKIFRKDDWFDVFDFNQWVSWVLETIDVRDKCLIEKYFFDGYTYKSAGKKVQNLSYDKKINEMEGISKERARQAIKRAIRILRHPTRLKKIGNLERG